MPSARSFFRVRFTWLCRAWALRRCAHVIFLTAFASSFSFDRRDDNPHERTSAASAVCSWQTVSSELFSPPFLTHTRQEQVAHRRQDQVTLQPQIASPLVLVQPDLALVVLKATLHPPAREGDQKQSPNAGPRRRVAHEELHLVRVQHIAGDQQVKGLTRQAVGPLDRQHHVLALPDHRPLLAILDPEPLPRLVPQPWGLEQFVNPLGWAGAAGQPGHLSAAAAAVLVVRPGDHPRRVEPAGEAARDRGAVPLRPRRQGPQQFGLAAVALVERQPVEPEAVGDRPVVKLQRDLPLRPVHQVVGDAGLAAAVTVGVPALGQEQLTVEQAVEVAAGQPQLDGDDAVLGLAQPAAPLLLDAGGLVPLLGIAGLVEEPDGVGALVLGGDEPLESVAHPALLPLELAEELLQGARGDIRLQRDRLDALLGQVGELPADVDTQVGAGVLATEAVVEVTEELNQLRLQPTDLVDVHALPSGSHWQSRASLRGGVEARST